MGVTPPRAGREVTETKPFHFSRPLAIFFHDVLIFNQPKPPHNPAGAGTVVASGRFAVR